MREELISFTTAKLAKEKRFKIFGEKAYTIDGEGCIAITSSFFNARKYPIYNVVTQTFLQKWLRETKNIMIFIDFHLSEHYFVARIVCKENSGWESYKVSNSESKLYERALEIGLQEALKLIP